MPRNHDRFVTMVPTQYGPRLAPTPEVISTTMRHDRALGESLMRSRIQTRDAAMLPGATKPPTKSKRFGTGDEDDPEDLQSVAPGEIVATLPAPPENSHYEIELREDGYAVVLADGPRLGPYDLPEENVGDRLSFGPSGNPKLRRMNDAARKFWRNGARTTDADLADVVYKCRIKAPDERLELRGPDQNGDYEVVLHRPSKPIAGNTPLGASGTGPEQRSKGATAPESRTGDRRPSLADMNRMARAHWSGVRR